MTDSVIDRAALQRLMRVIGDDPAELRDLIECFLEEGPILVADLCAAAALSDLDALRRAAHTLKSSARDFGAQRLETLCERLERDSRAGPVPNGRSRSTGNRGRARCRRAGATRASGPGDSPLGCSVGRQEAEWVPSLCSSSTIIGPTA